MAAALLAGGAAAWLSHPSARGPELGGASAPVTATALTPPTEPPRTTSPTAPPSTQPSLPAPTRFEADSVAISMRVRPVGVAADGQMALPPTPAVMGWYEYGPRPGDKQGATVLAAHRDMPDFGTGPAARLERLHPGDQLTVRSGSAVQQYRVTQVSRLAKKGLDLEAIFDRSGAGRLHVVTCGGRFDPATRSYEQNLVVVAVPVG